MDGAADLPKVKPDKPDELVELVDALQKIDAASPLAKLNETTIADNNGGRITL